MLRLAIVETVAERDERLWFQPRNKGFEAGDGRARIVRRERNTARGEG